MSELKVQVVKIDEINVHPNADRLELATIKGWNCVVQKGLYKAGDRAIYFPIDSILPPEVETKIFGIDSKIKLNKSRVRTIKLRGAISQGLITPLELFTDNNAVVGYDLTKKLGVTKYEPPVKHQNRLSGGGKKTKKQPNPHFKKYTSIENFKNYNKLFEEGEPVCITEKIHGTNFRAGWVKGTSWWSRVKAFFNVGDDYEFVFGSHNVQLQNKFLAKTYYDTNVYAEAVVKYDLKKLIPKGMVIYGEIYGDGIQKNYHYGCKKGEHKLVIFDIMKEGEYLSYIDFRHIADSLDLRVVTPLFIGELDLEKAKELAKGDSIFCKRQKIREGVVIKPMIEEKSYIGRKVLKLINDDYLLNKDNTDLH